MKLSLFPVFADLVLVGGLLLILGVGALPLPVASGTLGGPGLLARYPSALLGGGRARPCGLVTVSSLRFV